MSSKLLTRGVWHSENLVVASAALLLLLVIIAPLRTGLSSLMKAVHKVLNTCTIERGTLSLFQQPGLWLPTQLFSCVT
jgi:predicted Co/Zn/Cd cation transporter (cation efflux family)